MISKVGDVAAYIRELDAERKPPIKKLRKLCRQYLAGYEEAMEYGLPVYKRNGAMEVSFASQKRYIALYVLKKDVLDKFRGELPKSRVGKGCVRFTKPEKIDFDLVKRVLIATAQSKSAPC